MDVQEALDAPVFYSVHFPSSFYPRERFPGRMAAEGRIPRAVIKVLEDRGHEVEVKGDWVMGKALGIRVDRDRGVISGGASPRHGIAYALGW
jgi:gamma-glutamyltranspeptidase/glutathione hydrolase